MDIQTGAGTVSRFIILVPHRDSLKALAEYRRRLFSAGTSGAYSFPLAAPLSAVSRPFSRGELKQLAVNIRNLGAKAGGKIQGSRGLRYRSFFGVLLDIPVEESLFPESARGKLLSAASSAVLCAALVDAGEDPPPDEPPPLSFRAAYLANLTLRPLPGGDIRYSFEWMIGSPAWLPKNISA